ncbi:MAG: alginate export family protein, partial [Gammaproteobacteria bacterium]
MLLTFSSAGNAQENSNKHRAWWLSDALNLPRWLSWGIQQRTRYETLTNQFRAGGQGGDQVLALRTDIFLEAAIDELRIGGEFMDARISLDDAGTPVDNNLVDTFDILQLYVAWTTKNMFGTGLDSDFRFGRQTMDLGSRRLVVRNGFRNTINSFTGLHLNLADADKVQWRLFLFNPVRRLPDDPVAIREGRHEFDTRDTGTYFGG